MNGQDTCIFIPDADGISFTDLILNRVKLGETRKMSVHLPVGKWIGIAKNKMVVGKVLLDRPITIDKDSFQYAHAYISGTRYDIQDGHTKRYYPIIDIVDMRNDPLPVVRFGALYGKY